MRRTMPWRSGRRVLVFGGAALLAASAAWSAPDKACPDGDSRAVRVDVTVDAGAGSVAVDPSTVEVYLKPGPKEPARVCWVIAGLADGQVLRLTDKEAGGEAPFSGLTRQVKGASPFINSGNPSRAGTWMYGVEVTDAKGRTVAKVDPEVIVKGNASP